MRDELRESLALLPCRSHARIRISKTIERSIEEFICRRSTSACALSVEGPAENQLCRTIMLSPHPPEPMVNKRGLSDTSPGNDRDNIYIPVCPCIIQKSDILLSTKNVTSGNGQPGYANLLRCNACWRLGSSDMRSGKERPLQALTSDSTARIDGGCYRGIAFTS